MVGKIHCVGGQIFISSRLWLPHYPSLCMGKPAFRVVCPSLSGLGAQFYLIQHTPPIDFIIFFPFYFQIFKRVGVFITNPIVSQYSNVLCLGTNGRHQK